MDPRDVLPEIKMKSAYVRQKTGEIRERVFEKFSGFGISCVKYKMGNRTVEVGPADYMAIKERWFTDVILNVLFHWVLNHTLKESDKDRVQVFSTAMAEVINLFIKDDPGAELRADLATKNVNIFDKDVVVFPLWESSHWMQGVIAWPHICVWDSLRPHSYTSLFEGISKFIKYQFVTKKEAESGRNRGALLYSGPLTTPEHEAVRKILRERGEEDHRLLTCSAPDCTQQKNQNDCGLMVVQMLHETLKKVGQDNPDFLSMPDLSNHRYTRNFWFKNFYLWMARQNPSDDKSPKKEHLIELEKIKRQMRKEKKTSRLAPVDGTMYQIKLNKRGKVRSIRRIN